MSTEIEEFLARYRADIETRLREQISRTRAVAPEATTARIKDLQLGQEIENIKRLSDNPDVQAALESLARDVLTRL